MLYIVEKSRLNKNQQKFNTVKDYRMLDNAWDRFNDYIGEHNIQTPVTIAQFEDILKKIDVDKKFEPIKEHILYSFQYECYSWPLVEREKQQKTN